MTVTNLDTSRSLTHVRPLLGSFLVNVAIGYTLYFVTLAQPEPPAWAIGYIEHLKPTIRALDVAAQLSDHPFPAQVMILYAALSAVLLTMYYVYCVFLVKDIRQEFYRRSYEGAQRLRGTPNLRLKVGGAAVLGLIAFGLIFPIIFFHMGGGSGPSDISWRVAALFSSSILSVTFLLLLSGLTALVCALSPWGIYMSICSVKSNTLTRS